MGRHTNISRWLAFIGVAVVVAFSIVIVVILLPSTAAIAPVHVANVPIRLSIPTIKVDATVESLGLAADGTMAVPKDPGNAAWYGLGTRPGEIGSAVMAGHSGWKENIPAVFDDLYKLKKGDKIYVEDTTGTTTVFVVREMRTYDPKADATGIFGSNDGKAHLNLITCAGAWDSFSESSSERLVIFADKESD